jgi:hypothetical protein
MRAEEGTDYLEIDGRRFCRWRGARERDPDFRLTLRTGLRLAIAVLGFYGLLVVWAIIGKPEIDLLTLVLLIGTQTVLVNPLLVDAIPSTRKALRAKKKPPVSGRSDDPPGGVPIEVGVGGLGSLGWTSGALDVDQGRLRFRGEAFDFALRKGDFLRPNRAAMRLGFGRDVGLAAPEGLSLAISLSAQRSRRADLLKLLENWDREEAENGEALYPPVDYRAPVPTLVDCAVDALSYVPPAATAAAGLAILVALSPRGLFPGHINWASAAGAGFALAMSQTLSIFILTAGRRIRHRSITEWLSHERA